MKSSFRSLAFSSAAFGCLLGLSSTAQAVDYTWTNTTNNGNVNKWNPGSGQSTWSPLGGSPSAITDTATFGPNDTSQSTSGQTLSVNSGISIAGLTLNNGYNFTIGAGNLTSFSVTSLNKGGSGVVTIATNGPVASAGNVSITNAAGALNFTNGLTATNVTGIGTIGGNVTINGTHSVGLAPGSAATQNFSNNLTYGSSSIFSWDLTQSSTSTGFDKVTATGNITAAGTFNVILGGSVLTDITNLSNSFWNTPFSTKSWAMSDIFGKAITGAFGSVTTSANVSNYGAFTINGSNLTWTASYSAVPEPTSALAGILLGAGLLRRKRR